MYTVTKTVQNYSKYIRNGKIVQKTKKMTIYVQYFSKITWNFVKMSNIFKCYSEFSQNYYKKLKKFKNCSKFFKM